MPDMEMDVNSEPTLDEGYCIKIEVLKDGFTVSDPLPLESKSDESMELEAESEDYTDTDGELIPDLPSMLKNVMAVIKQNPVAGGEESGFEESVAE